MSMMYIYVGESSTKAPKIIPGVSHLPYNDKFASFNMFSLRRRQLRGEYG